MTMNPYKILGVDKHATIPTIKSGYRAMLKVHHPDQGGDPERLAEVMEAWSILSDPAAKKLYDTTGAIKKDDAVRARQRVIGAMVNLFAEAIETIQNNGHSVEEVDVMAGMLQVARTRLSNVREKINNLSQQIHQMTKLRDRITRKDDEENLFAAILNNELAPKVESLLQLENDAAVMEHVITELESYESPVDMIRVMQMSQHGGWYNTTSSSSTASSYTVRRF